MNYTQFTIQRLEEAKGDPIFCAVSDQSEKEAIESTTIVKICKYNVEDDDFNDTSGLWWNYAVPVTVTPIQLPN